MKLHSPHHNALRRVLVAEVAFLKAVGWCEVPEPAYYEDVAWTPGRWRRKRHVADINVAAEEHWYYKGVDQAEAVRQARVGVVPSAVGRGGGELYTLINAEIEYLKVAKNGRTKAPAWTKFGTVGWANGIQKRVVPHWQAVQQQRSKDRTDLRSLGILIP